MKWVSTAVGIIVATAAAHVAAADTRPVKDPDGNTLAVLVTCSDCQTDSTEKRCHTGVEEGWADGQPCGKCLLTENAGKRLVYPYDLHVTGTLTDAAGQPLKDRYVKMFMSNGWNVRTRTTADGFFRLILGATADRKSSAPLIIDLGKRVDTQATETNYAMFFVPDGYKQCPAPPPKASGGGKHSGGKKKK